MVSIALWLAYLLLDLAALHSITSVSKKIYVPKIINVAEVYQWLEEVAQTNLVLASVKLELQKNNCCAIYSMFAAAYLTCSSFSTAFALFSRCGLNLVHHLGHVVGVEKRRRCRCCRRGRRRSFGKR